jgi:hypothetical protein
MKTSAWRESWSADVQWSPQNLFGVGLKIEESDTKPSNDWKPCLSLEILKAALAAEPGKGWIKWLPPVALKRFSQCTTPRKNRSMPGGADEFTDLLGIYSLTPRPPKLPSGISMTSTWVPWYDILLFFLRVGLTKIWELGSDPIAIRGNAVLEGPV